MGEKRQKKQKKAKQAMKECSYGVEVMYKSCRARRDEDFEYKIGPIGHQERQFRKQGSQPKIDFQKTFLGSFQTPTQNFGTLGPLLPFHVQTFPPAESTTPSSFCSKNRQIEEICTDLLECKETFTNFLTFVSVTNLVGTYCMI